MPSRTATVVLALTGLLSCPPCHAASNEAIEPDSLALGLVVGHDWFDQRDTDEVRPTLNYVGLWFAVHVSDVLQLGAEWRTSINPYGCDFYLPCYEYELSSIGALAEGRLVLTENHAQGFEAWASLSPAAVRLSRREPSFSPENTAWGVGVTGRVGPRVRMRGLTLAPFLEGFWASVDSSIGYGLGLQAGVRF